jgi:hypothetical protein
MHEIDHLKHCKALIKWDLLNWFSIKPSLMWRTGETVKWNFASGLIDRISWIVLAMLSWIVWIESNSLPNSFEALYGNLLLFLDFETIYPGCSVGKNNMRASAKCCFVTSIKALMEVKKQLCPSSITQNVVQTVPLLIVKNRSSSLK